MRTTKKGTIKLPVQTLNLGLIPNINNLHKIFFQFDVKVASNGNKSFALVAYPSYGKGNKKIGKKIIMPVKKEKIHELQLPLTLGNLELKYSAIKNWVNDGNMNLTFTPRRYNPNPHTQYTVSDGMSLSTATANPSPPAKPV